MSFRDTLGEVTPRALSVEQVLLYGGALLLATEGLFSLVGSDTALWAGCAAIFWAASRKQGEE
jgi:hypothetical protein